MAIIVQARMGSTRLPGKVLARLRGETVLAHVLHRCAMVPGVDTVCCAVADDPDSDPVAIEAEQCGVAVYRGSQTDVRGRYFAAAKALGATLVMRVTSDCPLIDPNICGRVLQLRAAHDADYACNNMPPAWPHGLDCEAFTTAALARSIDERDDPGDREHVTPWLRNHAGLKRVNLDGPGGEFPALRWTLDYAEDLKFLKALFEHLPADPRIAGFPEIIAVLEEHPEISGLNSIRHDKSRAVESGTPIEPVLRIR